MIEFTLNGKPVTHEGDPDMPLLWYVRDEAGFTGTKYGCGIAACGACTLYVDNQPTRSCTTPVSAVAGAQVATIEALRGVEADAVQAAWRMLDVVQCGYCQSGQIMAATALLTANKNPTDAEIDAAMDGNICRCATYPRIRQAIRRAADIMGA